MGRIEIAKAQDKPRSLGRPIMSYHNLSARIWATAAVIVIPLSPVTGLGWWLPLHLALLGAVSQAIVGGQLMFSATLGLSRGPARSTILTQLALLNLAAALVVGGRLWDARAAFIAGVTIFVVAIGWVGWQVNRLWKRSVNRRFAITGTFYGAAAASIIVGAAIGGALGIDAFDGPDSYLAHRGVHMTLNVFGWAGLTIVGTAITLLPTILHVRAPKFGAVRRAPWLMLGGLLILSTGATTSIEWLAAAGMGCYAGGLISFGAYVRRILVIPRRRRIPTAALHLIAASMWAGMTTIVLVILWAGGNHGAIRDAVVVGGAAGFAFQALLGAWSFLLPSARPVMPERRRRELVAMEVGGRMQVFAYNAGLVAVFIGLRTDIDVSLAGICVAWSAALWALVKTWTFPALARLSRVRMWSERWWADPTSGRGTSPPNGTGEESP